MCLSLFVVGLRAYLLAFVVNIFLFIVCPAPLDVKCPTDYNKDVTIYKEFHWVKKKYNIPGTMFMLLPLGKLETMAAPN